MTPSLVSRYRGAGVLIDTNILLLYVVGAFDPERIQAFKHTRRFTPEDHGLLLDFLKHFRRIVTTPHILAEVSNLAGELSGRVKDGVFQKLTAGIALYDERHAPAAEVVRAPTSRASASRTSPSSAMRGTDSWC